MQWGRSKSTPRRALNQHIGKAVGELGEVRQEEGKCRGYSNRGRGARRRVEGESQRGRLDLARLLIEHGTDATAQNNYGTTPLHWASFKGHVDVARLLIEHSAT